MGSHWESNPKPPTLAVDALTTELHQPCSNPALSLELEEQANDGMDTCMYTHTPTPSPFASVL